MLDLVMKLAKKKLNAMHLVKLEEESPKHEYMRLDLELDELCSLHAVDLKELKSMDATSLFSYLGADGEKAEHHLARMRELWGQLPAEERSYLSAPNKELAEYDELAKDFQEKEYLSLDRELEAEASVCNLAFHELVQMSHSEMIKFLGRERAGEVVKKYARAVMLWKQLTPEQQDRNSLKKPNRMY